MLGKKLKFFKLKESSKLSIRLYRPTVEPIILFCMAGLSFSSIAFQNYLFEGICFHRYSANPDELIKLNVSSQKYMDSFSISNQLNESLPERIQPGEFCRKHIKHFRSEYKSISAETSRVVFYGYSILDFLTGRNGERIFRNSA